MAKLKYLVCEIIGIALLVNLASAGFYYNVEMDYERGEIKIKSVRVEFSQFDYEESFSELFINYRAEIANGDKLYETVFNVPNREIYDVANESGEMVSGGINELENVSFSILLPYYEQGEEIIIYNGSEELARVSIRDYSKKEAEEESRIISGEREEVKSDSGEEDNKTFISRTADYKAGIVVLIGIILIVIVYFITRKNMGAKKKK